MNLICLGKSSPERESNPRPSAYKADATEAHDHNRKQFVLSIKHKELKFDML
jgi:hypothetical protein